MDRKDDIKKLNKRQAEILIQVARKMIRDRNVRADNKQLPTYNKHRKNN